MSQKVEKFLFALIVSTMILIVLGIILIGAIGYEEDRHAAQDTYANQT